MRKYHAASRRRGNNTRRVALLQKMIDQLAIEPDLDQQTG
jgi:hypothetical protein